VANLHLQVVLEMAGSDTSPFVVIAGVNREDLAIFMSNINIAGAISVVLFPYIIASWQLIIRMGIIETILLTIYRHFARIAMY
jgi:hypothetical protein